MQGGKTDEESLKLYKDLLNRKKPNKVGMKRSLKDSEHMLMKMQGALTQALGTLRSPYIVDMTSARGQTTIDAEDDQVLRTDIWQSNNSQL